MSDLTVLLPVYNGDASFVRQSINSILKQTYKDFILLIIDDGSSKEIKDLLTEFERKDSRINILRHSTNMGLIYSLNEGLNKATTKWVARMDSDDISEEHRLEWQMDYLIQHPETTVLGCRATYLESGKEFPLSTMPLYHEEIIALLPFVCVFVHPTVIFNRESILKVGGYPQIPGAEDYALWIKLMFCCKECKFTILKNILLKYRRGNKKLDYKKMQEQSGEVIRQYILKSLNVGCSTFDRTNTSSGISYYLIKSAELQKIKLNLKKSFPGISDIFLNYAVLREKNRITRGGANFSLSVFCYRILTGVQSIFFSIIIKILRTLR